MIRSSGAQYGGAFAQIPRTLARISRPAAGVWAGVRVRVRARRRVRTGVRVRVRVGSSARRSRSGGGVGLWG